MSAELRMLKPRDFCLTRLDMSKTRLILEISIVILILESYCSKQASDNDARGDHSTKQDCRGPFRTRPAGYRDRGRVSIARDPARDFESCRRLERACTVSRLVLLVAHCQSGV